MLIDFSIVDSITSFLIIKNLEKLAVANHILEDSPNFVDIFFNCEESSNSSFESLTSDDNVNGSLQLGVFTLICLQFEVELANFLEVNLTGFFNRTFEEFFNFWIQSLVQVVILNLIDFLSLVWLVIVSGIYLFGMLNILKISNGHFFNLLIFFFDFGFQLLNLIFQQFDFILVSMTFLILVLLCLTDSLNLMRRLYI